MLDLPPMVNRMERSTYYHRGPVKGLTSPSVIPTGLDPAAVQMWGLVFSSILVNCQNQPNTPIPDLLPVVRCLVLVLCCILVLDAVVLAPMFVPIRHDVALVRHNVVPVHQVVVLVLNTHPTHYKFSSISSWPRPLFLIQVYHIVVFVLM